MVESLPGATTALLEELEREKARADAAEAEAQAQHARWCNEVVDHCPHPAEEGVCCSECLAAALKALDAARRECEGLRTATRSLIEAAEALTNGVIPTLYDDDLTKPRMVEYLRKLPGLLNACAQAASDAAAALAAPAEQTREALP